LITPKGKDGPCKFGIADNPLMRVSVIQVGNWVDLEPRKWWWMAGRLLTIRVETELIEHLCRAEKHIRGEWFDIAADEAQSLAEATMEKMGLPWISEERLRALEDQAIAQVIGFAK